MIFNAFVKLPEFPLLQYFFEITLNYNFLMSEGIPDGSISKHTHE